MELERFVQVAKEAVADVLSRLPREADLDHMLHLHVSDDAPEVVVRVPPEPKDLRDAVIASFTRMMHPKFAAFMSSVWITKYAKGGQAGERVDGVCITVVSQLTERSTTAEVLRDGEHPRLGPWNEWDRGTQVAGRIVDALREGLPKVNGN